ncbi:M56 family metallopeptidase [Serinicoccus sp. LYQ131]|uniref:M56 family metallopeptidase n=1 Tax=Serinicoccus sp. LYQ131 TaxID=3378797 RepID=UPI00385264E8
MPVGPPLLSATVVVAALTLTLLAPRLLPRWTSLRQMPGAGLLLWQSVSITGVLCALLAAPVTALSTGLNQPLLLGVAVALSALMLARLLVSGHTVGTDLRRRRARHRELIDLVGERLQDTPASSGTTPPGYAHPPVAVVAQGNPTAYCLPGAGDRIVLTQAALDRLGPPELTAVLEHEQAHLDQRHDLLLELFTVLHEAVPRGLRVPAALAEVHLLAEALADRVAEQRTAPTDLARALVAMATGAPAQVTTRVRLLATPPAPRHTRALVSLLAVLLLALPAALAVGVLVLDRG